MIKLTQKKGSASVFLLIILATCLLAISIIIEASSGKAARSYCNGIFDLAGRSVLSEFDIDLKNDYGLLAIADDDRAVAGKIARYIEYSLDSRKQRTDLFHLGLDHVKIDLGPHAMTNIDSFEQQILADVKYRFSIGWLSLSHLLENWNSYKVKEEEISDTDNERENRILKNSTIIEQLPSTKMKIGHNFLDNIRLPDMDEIFNLPANIAVNLYITERFRHRLDTPLWKDTFFVNELEYILAGKYSDRSNYIIVKASLVAFRTGINLTHIYTNHDKREALAAAAAVLTPGPTAPATQIALASSWAAGEAAIDVRRLEKGEKVPLIKTADDWVLSLENLLDEEDPDLNFEEDSDKGLDYEQYLLLFLCFQDRDIKLLRCMDLIQLNMKGNHNGKFLMCNCYSGFDYNIRIKRTGSFLGFNFNRTGDFYGSHVF